MRIIEDEKSYMARTLFNQFCIGYKNRDLPFLMKIFSENIESWGTGADEYQRGLEGVAQQLQRDWSQAEASAIEIVSFLPSNLTASWAAALCMAIIQIGGVTYKVENLRGTIVIEKEEGVWKIAHMHASFPDSRNPENASFPVG